MLACALGYINLRHKGCYGFGGNVKRLNDNTHVFLAHNVEFFTEKELEHNEHREKEILLDESEDICKPIFDGLFQRLL